MKAKTNIVINLTSPAVRLAVALVTTPLYVRHVGEARYGVIWIMLVLLGYFGFMDLGLGRAATNALAKLRSAPQSERARVLLTTLILNLCFGLVGAVLLFVCGGYFVEHLLSVPESIKPEVAAAFPWMAGVFPLTLVSGVGIGALESRERFLLANILQILGMTMSQTVPVIMAIAVNPSLAVVIPAAALTQAANAVVVLTVVYRIEGPFSFRGFDRREASALLGYGGWVSVSNVVGPLLVSGDQFLIGSLLGAASVTHYAIPMTLIVRSQIFPAAVARTFFPRMSSLPHDAAGALGGRALSALAHGYAMVCGPAIILASTFFRYWIGPDFAAVAAPVAKILFFGGWMNGLAFVAFTLLQGQGRPDLTGRIHVFELLPFLAVLWVLTSTLGIVGAAIAWTLRCSVDAAIMCYAAGLGRKEILPALLPGAVLLLSAIAAFVIGSNPAAILFAAILVGLLSLFLACVFSHDWRKLVLRDMLPRLAAAHRIASPR
ncbi:MAG: oligosaccharide flippase family protein [Hyphomicrobiales bacterium]|nr:oligosaccharide flippase family protein [Hyphomicrobiales bacterium]